MKKYAFIVVVCLVFTVFSSVYCQPINKIIVNKEGLVGIGTDTPDNELEVKAQGDTWIGVDTENENVEDADAGIIFSDGGTKRWMIFLLIYR